MFKNSFFAYVCISSVQFSLPRIKIACCFQKTQYKYCMQAFAICKIFLLRFVSMLVVAFSSWWYFRFFAFPNVSVTKQFFQIFPSNFPHFCLCIFVHCFVVSLRCPVCLTLQIFIVHCPLQQQPFVFVLFSHFRFLCFQQVLTQTFASFIDQVALT